MTTTRDRRAAWFASAFATVAALAASRDARAQSCAPTVVVNPFVTRTNGPVRPQNLNPTGINFADCEADATLGFSLTLNSFCADVHLEAWVGQSDCTPLAARATASATCSPLLAAAIPAAQSVNISLRAQDIAAAVVAGSGKPTTYASATEAACHGQTVDGPVPLSIYFLWLDGPGNPVGTGGKYDLKASLRGPAAPSHVAATAGDGNLSVTWASAGDSATEGFVVYTDPPAGTSTSAIDGGSSEAGPVFSTCPSSVFASDGGQRLVAPKYLAAAIGGSASTNATIRGLTNNVEYSVAVAATDAFDNVGPLASPACAAPSSARSGGTCALTGRVGASGTSASALGGTLALLCLASLARRRKSASS